MALTICKECEGQISTSAENCPHCGARLRMSFLHKLTLGTSAAYVLFFVIAPIILTILLVPDWAWSVIGWAWNFLEWIGLSVWEAVAWLFVLL